MKLNQILAGIGILGLSMTACTADEQLGVNQNDGAISYKVNTSNQTRAAHSYCANNMPGAFKVWATYTSDEQKTPEAYIEGVDVTKISGTSYQSNPVYKWPMGTNVKMDFYAVVDADGLEVENGKIIKNYTVVDDVKQQKDLMYAVKKSATPADESVTLNFRHALSQIAFQAQNENPNIKITINSITINNVYGSGDYSLPLFGTDNQYVNHTNIGSNTTEISMSRGSWNCENSEKKSFSLNFGEGIELTTPAANATTFTIDKLTEHSDGSNSADDILTMIPQFSGSVEENLRESSFKINLTVATSTGADGKFSNAVTNDIDVPVMIEWREGCRYVYTFKFANDWTINDSKDIVFTCTADDYIPRDWNNEAVINEPEATNVPKPVLMCENYTFEDGTTGPLYFADRNLGATRPYATGDWYGWGCKLALENSTDFNKDNIDIWASRVTWDELKTVQDMDSYGNYNRQVDNPCLDARIGSNWQVPTAKELEWLIDNCNWSYNSTNGCFVATSKSTGNSIILPKAGKMTESSNQGFDDMVQLWSRSAVISESDPLYVESDIEERYLFKTFNLISNYADGFASTFKPYIALEAPYYGYQIRPVCYSLE